MAYEYNSQDQRFEFPNPYKIENIFKFIAATFFILAGVWLLFHAKSAFSVGILVTIIPLMVSIAMFSYGGILLASSLSKLKFYFGRNQPVGLAQELQAQEIGTTQSAQHIKDILRQSALTYQEPQGSVNGILYSLFPNLIFSPLFIRQAAEVQFQNALIFIITLCSSLVAFASATSQSVEWLGILYNIILLVVLLRPLLNPNSGPQSIGISKIIILVMLAVIGPVLIPYLLHDLSAPAWLPSMGKAIFTLIAALISIVIFFLAVLAQMVKSPPQASAGMVQDSLSMNCQPMQVFDELERHLQNQWVSSIPNRIYSRLLPTLQFNDSRGTFEGEILEETQPTPANTLKDITLSSCFKEKQYIWLGILNSFALICFGAAIVLICIFATSIYNGQSIDSRYFSYAFFAVSMWILGKFCFDHGNYLWSRFDFVSDLIWVEAKGNYQLSNMNIGRYLDDSIKTQKEVVNIESMTLRIWYAEIYTTAYGKNEQRSILSMIARKDRAIQLQQHLMTFAQEQSIIVAPTASSDLQRISAINQLNHSNQGNNPATDSNKKSILPQFESSSVHYTSTDQSQIQTNSDTVTKKIFCTACGHALVETMKFCPQCGTQRIT